MTSRLLLIIFVLPLLDCNYSKQEATKLNNTIQKIGFATGGCYGKCPFLAIEIDSTMSYKFYGGRYAEKKGYFKGTVTQLFWDSLNIKLEKINLNQLDTLYNSSVDDMSIECYLSFEQKFKTIKGQEMSIPESVRQIFYWIMNSYKNIALTRVDTLNFETKIQYGPGLIPPPKNMKFTTSKTDN
jgi:hypothetical protein